MDVQITLEDYSSTQESNSARSSSSSILHSRHLNVPTITSNVGHQDGGSNSGKPSKAVEDQLQPADGRGRYLSVSATSSSGGSRNGIESVRSADDRLADSQSLSEVQSNGIESNDRNDIQRESSFSREVAAFCEKLPQEESSQQISDSRHSLTQIKVHAQQMYLTIKEQEERLASEQREVQDMMNEREEQITQLQGLLADKQTEIDDLKRNLEERRNPGVVPTTNKGMGEQSPKINPSKLKTMDEIETRIRTLNREIFRWEEEKAKLGIAKLHSEPSRRPEPRHKILRPIPKLLTLPATVDSPRPQWPLKPSKLTFGSDKNGSIGKTYETAGDGESSHVETKHEIRIASLQISIEDLQTKLAKMKQKLQAKEKEFEALKQTYENHKKTSHDQENVLKIQLTEYQDKLIAMARSLELNNVHSSPSL